MVAKSPLFTRVTEGNSWEKKGSVDGLQAFGGELKASLGKAISPTYHAESRPTCKCDERRPSPHPRERAISDKPGKCINGSTTQAILGHLIYNVQRWQQKDYRKICLKIERKFQEGCFENSFFSVVDLTTRTIVQQFLHVAKCMALKIMLGSIQF